VNNAAAASAAARKHEIDQDAAMMRRTSATNTVDHRYYIEFPLEHLNPRHTGSRGYGLGVSAGFSSTDITWKATGKNGV
jgi:predicted lipoprotein